MEMLLLVLLFILIGYLLARLGSSRRERRAARQPVMPGWRDRLEDSWKGAFDRRGLTDDFRVWVYGDPSANLPDDFKHWFGGLTDRDAQEFTHSLANYSRGMGFSLTQLVKGGLDDDPMLRQVFVEAIVVYSSAYRKAKQAQQAAVEAEAQGKQRHVPRGKKSAEKAPSAPANGGAATEGIEAPQAA
jgi:hypothetical protein